MSMVSVTLDRSLNHLDSSAGSWYDSTTALNCAEVPKSVETNPGDRITTGHPIGRKNNIKQKLSNIVNNAVRRILTQFIYHLMDQSTSFY